MIKQAAFTLIELLVGLLVSLFLIIAMATFLGNAGYMFQGQKSLLKDRAEVQRAMTFIARDMLDIGFGANGNGEITVDGNTAYFLEMIDNGGADGLNIDLSYYKSLDSMEYVAEAGDGKVYSYEAVTYTIDNGFVHPVTGAATTLLRRNGEPFLLDVTEFSVALGYDVDNNGTIEETEWEYGEPSSFDAKSTLYGNANKVRISLIKTSLDQDGNVVDSELNREILLRNRED